MRTAPSAAQMFWLLTRLRLVRLFNVMSSMSSWGKKKAQRGGTAKKAVMGPIVGVAVALMMLGVFGSTAYQGLNRLHQTADRTVAALSTNLEPGIFSAELMHAAAGMLVLLLLVSIFTDVGGRNVVQHEWDMEWLFTLPISLPTLLWARLVERTASNGFALIAFVPTCTILAWESGYDWWSPLVGVVGSLTMLALAAIGRSLVDVGLRLSLSPGQLRNLQAVLSVVGMVGMYLMISIGSSQGTSYGITVVRAMPAWVDWAPPGLLVRAINAPQADQAWVLALGLVAEVALLAMLAVAWMQHQLRHGLAGTGARESGRQPDVASSSSRPESKGGLWFALHRRELLLLARDRNFLIQTLVLPVVIVGSQYVLKGGFGSLADLWGTASSAALAAFGLVSYTLMLSAFQTINTEGGGLWLLYTFPRSLGSVLKDKAQLWAAIGLVYALLIVTPGIILFGDEGWHALWLVGLAVVGVPIFSVIAVALGVFASNPLATEQTQKVRSNYAALYLMLSAAYGYTIWADKWWLAAEIVVLMGLLAFSLWQKMNDHLPYLLDPTALPPMRVTAADGVIAAVGFLLMQQLFLVLWFTNHWGSRGAGLVVSFVASGALIYGMVRLTYWRGKAQDVPAVWGATQTRSWGTGLTMGATAAALGLLYINVARLWGVEPTDLPSSGDPNVFRYWFAPLAVLAAPVFEEFIFRGLIFGGLRRNMRLLPAAAASAAVFAIVHPPMSVIPVFGLGLCTAFAYERTRKLAAPMITHAVYNLVIVAYQWG